MNKREEFIKLQNEAIEKIKEAMQGLKELKIIDIDETESPLVDDGNDDYDTYTLDRVTVKDDGSVVFSASSCDNCEDYKATDLRVGTLMDIAGFLEEHEDEIKELLPKKKYVIRFNWRQWVDITVEANDEGEAYELATDRYNEGDYEEDSDNLENMDAENVTTEYEENGDPYPNEE